MSSDPFQKWAEKLSQIMQEAPAPSGSVIFCDTYHERLVIVDQTWADRFRGDYSDALDSVHADDPGVIAIVPMAWPVRVV